MSVRIMTQVWDLDLPPNLKFVLLALADNANDDGFCWPSQRTIADKCSITDRQVRNHLTTLREMGLLEVTRRGKKRTNVYQLTIGDRKPTSASDRNLTSGPQEPPVEPEIATRSRARTERQQQHDLRIEALIEAMGWTRESMTPGAVRSVAVAAAQLKDLAPTREEVLARARVYQRTQPGKLTPHALVKWWADCEPDAVCPNGCGPDGYYYANESDPYPVACQHPPCGEKRRVRS